MRPSYTYIKYSEKIHKCIWRVLVVMNIPPTKRGRILLISLSPRGIFQGVLLGSTSGNMTALEYA
jgi:hypothetical protein